MSRREEKSYHIKWAGVSAVFLMLAFFVLQKSTVHATTFTPCRVITNQQLITPFPNELK